MSRNGKVRLFFRDQEYDFRLAIGQCVELQELTGDGIMRTLERVMYIAVGDIRHVLRLGLVGGGMAPEPAARLVDRHLTDGYFAECSQLATAVIEAAVRGAPEEQLGETQGETENPPSPAAEFDTPASMESEPRADGTPSKSTAPRSGNSPPASKATSGRRARRSGSRPSKGKSSPTS